MINYGLVRSTEKPKPLEITNELVFIANNITPYSKIIEDYEEQGFEYEYICYTKNEYIEQLAEKNQLLEEQVLITQEALSDLYELIEG